MKTNIGEDSMLSANEIVKEALQLSVAERIQLVEDLWDTIAEEPHKANIPEWHKEILDERLEAMEKNPDDYDDWVNVRKRIL